MFTGKKYVKRNYNSNSNNATAGYGFPPSQSYYFLLWGSRRLYCHKNNDDDDDDDDDDDKNTVSLPGVSEWPEKTAVIEVIVLVQASHL